MPAYDFFSNHYKTNIREIKGDDKNCQIFRGVVVELKKT